VSERVGYGAYKSVEEVGEEHDEEELKCPVDPSIPSCN
jgi:hypothetical protein